MKLKQTTKGTLESMLGGWGAGGGGGMSGGGSSSAQHYDDSSAAAAAAAAAAADVGYGPGGTRLTRDRGCRSRFSEEDSLKALEAAVGSWNKGRGAWAQSPPSARIAKIEELVKAPTPPPAAPLSAVR